MLLAALIFGLLLSASCDPARNRRNSPAPRTPGGTEVTATGTSEPKGNEPSTCDWFTQADAEAIIGAPVNQHREETPEADVPSPCSYDNPENHASIAVETASSQGYEDIKNDFEGKEGVESVPDLGENAFWTGSVLYVKANATFMFYVQMFETAGSTKEKHIQVAQKVMTGAGG